MRALAGLSLTAPPPISAVRQRTFLILITTFRWRLREVSVEPDSEGDDDTCYNMTRLIGLVVRLDSTASLRQQDLILSIEWKVKLILALSLMIGFHHTLHYIRSCGSFCAMTLCLFQNPASHSNVSGHSPLMSSVSSDCIRQPIVMTLANFSKLRASDRRNYLFQF